MTSAANFAILFNAGCTLRHGMETARINQSEHRAKTEKVRSQSQFVLNRNRINGMAPPKANFPKPIGLSNQWLTEGESQSQSQFR
jgi:hypothetical protein